MHTVTGPVTTPFWPRPTSIWISASPSFSPEAIDLGDQINGACATYSIIVDLTQTVALNTAYAVRHCATESAILRTHSGPTSCCAMRGGVCEALAPLNYTRDGARLAAG